MYTRNIVTLADLLTPPADCSQVAGSNALESGLIMNTVYSKVSNGARSRGHGGPASNFTIFCSWQALAGNLV